MKTIIPDVSIRSIASWLPSNKIPLSSFAEQYGEKETRDVIRTTGVEWVYRTDVNQKSSDLCFNAAEYLISKDNIDRESIDGVVVLTVTRDWALPDTSVYLQHKLGLKNETVCLDINYGCTGYIYGLMQAAMWIHSGLCQNVLVLGGDMLKNCLDPNAVGSIDASDIGTASLISKGTTGMAFHLCSDGARFDRIMMPHGGYIYQDGMGVFSFSIVNGPKSIRAVMDLMKWEDSDVDIYALHQSNQLIIKNVRMALKSSQEKFPVNMKEFGNSSSSTIPNLLCDLYGLNKANRPRHAVFCSYGAGLTCGSVALDLSKTHFYEPLNKQ